MKASFVVFVSLLPMTVCVLESCSNEPSKVDVRKAEIRAHDSIEIVDARKAKSVADSIIAFKEFGNMLYGGHNICHIVRFSAFKRV